MTERTHDLAALTTLTIAMVMTPLTHVTLVTLVMIIIVNQIGSAFPDLDQPTAEFYRELPAGSLVGRLVSPLLGSHRMISHSLLGLSLVSYGLWLVLNGYLVYLNYSKFTLFFSEYLTK